MWFATTVLSLLATSPAPAMDVVTPGFRKIVQQVQVENPDEFEGWTLLAVTRWGPAHMARIAPNVPFPYSAKYDTRIYALPAGTKIPMEAMKSDGSRDVFDEFGSGAPPVDQADQVAIVSPVRRSLTTVRVLGIDESGVRLERIGTQLFDADGDEIGVMRVWGLPLGAIALGVVGLIWIRRRRKARAAA
ncbi:MAG: hypothetical protein KDB61_00760 [Planctomycetes bacterium]|nr:hypothetical protein [Planctomycetota bacterium]